MYIIIGEHTLTVTLADNSSAAALQELLQKGDITVDAHDYGNFEKVGSLGTDLPANDEQITTEPGDVILYQGNQITLYYDTNSWSFTRLGKVQGVSADELKAILGEGDITMTLTLIEPNSTEENSEKPVVYMTTDISPQGLTCIYEALGASPTGRIAVKLSTGESENSNHLRPELIGDLVRSFDNPTIVECNTAYGGNRASTARHKQLAKDHGYTDLASVDIMDENGSMTLPVSGGDNLTENYVGASFGDYDYFIVLSHFKGHAMAGFGGAIKNISIGIASSEGKAHIHSGGTGGSMWGGDQDAFLESMAEAGKSVSDALDGNILYINVMNRLSVDCDCDGNPAEPDMHDIGILASFDPVAVDQACIDLVYSAQDGSSLIQRIESRNGLHTLEQAAKIGLGSREYELKSID
ncbi:MAG: DUF362 domain-containing protein [Lachnospiraceae bacterium]|nr:DUF362 domain-containing protein [Lachnospiraceae bacterium]